MFFLNLKQWDLEISSGWQTVYYTPSRKPNHMFSGLKKHKINLSKIFRSWIWLPVLGLVVFLLTLNPAVAAETSTLVPTPTILNVQDKAILSAGAVIKGTSLNFSQVLVTLDGGLVGYATAQLGTQGWQDWEFKLPDNLGFGQHKLELTALYFNNKQSQPTAINFYFQPALPTPTLFDPVLNSSTNFQQPWLVGLTENNVRLDVYLDGKLDGSLNTAINAEKKVVDFKYQPKNKLISGFHTVKVVAQSLLDGRRSQFSNEIIFEVRGGTQQNLTAASLPREVGKFMSPVPAPTILTPTTGSVTNYNQLTIAGVVHNEHYVRIFVDDQLIDGLMPTDHSSGVTSFSFTSATALAPGMHKVYVQAVNPRGQISGQSNIIRFIVLPTKYFVSQGVGQVKSTSTYQGNDASSIVSLNDDTLTENSNQADATSQPKIETWKLLVGVVIVIVIILILIWIFGAQDQDQNAAGIKKITVKKNSNDPPPVVQGPEISFDKVEGQVDDEHKIPPPPPGTPDLGL